MARCASKLGVTHSIQRGDRQTTVLHYFENGGDPRYPGCEMVMAVGNTNIDLRNTRQGRQTAGRSWPWTVLASHLQLTFLLCRLV